MKKRGRAFVAITAILLILVGIIPTAIAADDTRIMLDYLYMGPNEQASSAVEKFKAQVLSTQGTVDIVAPNWFSVTDAAGTVQDRANQEFVDWIHSKDKKIMPMVSKDYSSSYIQTVLATPALRSKVVNTLLAKVDTYNLDGLNLDFEGAGLEPAPGALTAFARELADGLHSRGKTATIAVMPKFGPNAPKWQGEYDYPELGKSMDYVVIMAYDQHWATSAPGAVAGLDWVGRSMDYAVSVIPTNKLIMGAPLYGRDWKNGKNGGGITYSYVKTLQQQYKAQIKWDAVSSTPYLVATDAKGIKHDVWYDNYSSLGYKMRLAAGLNLGGAAFWRLGYEDTAWWPGLNLQLQGGAAESDLVPGKTAPMPVQTGSSTTGEGHGVDGQAPASQTPASGTTQPNSTVSVSRGGSQRVRDIQGNPARKAIETVLDKGVMNTFSDSTFRPGNKVTRDQMATYLVRLLNLPVPTIKSTFKDVPANSSSARYIYAAKQAGLISGYSNGTFKPNKSVTRAEAAWMLSKAFKLKEEQLAQKTFKDVPTAYWAAKAIMATKKAGIINGFSGGDFRPGNVVTRAELATMLAKGIGK